VATVPLPPSLPPGRVVPVTSLHRQNDAKLRLPAHHARVGFIHLSRARLRNLPLGDFEIRPRLRYLRHPHLRHRQLIRAIGMHVLQEPFDLVQHGHHFPPACGVCRHFLGLEAPFQVGEHSLDLDHLRRPHVPLLGRSADGSRCV